MPGLRRRTDTRTAVVLVSLLVPAALPAVRSLHAQAVPPDAAGWSVGSQPTMVFGRTGGDTGEEFFGIVDVVGLPDGTVAVADGGRPGLSFFSPDGALVATGGRRGEGPGEFSNMSALVADPGGRLFVFDAGHQRISEWTIDGTFVADRQLVRQGTDRLVGGVGRLEDGGWYAWEQERMLAVNVGDLVSDTVGFHALAEGRVEDLLLRVPGAQSTLFEMGGGTGVRFGLLSPRSWGAVWGRCLLAGTSDSPVLRVVDGAGTELGEITLEAEAEPATDEHRDEWVGAMLARFGDQVGPGQREMLEQLAGAVAMAERVPIGQELLVDELGYIWVRRYELPEGGNSSEWRVFTETGSAIGKVVLPEGFSARVISADAILGVLAHPMGQQDVRLYELNRGRDAARRPAPRGCG